MSSDSGESHTSAPNGDQPGPDTGSAVPDAPAQTRNTVDTSDVAEDNTSGEEQQELESLDNGRNGITFARQRKVQDAQGNTAIPLSSATGRPDSPESMSTPDDTPSIQVGAQSGRGKQILIRYRAPVSPLPEVVFRRRTAHCALIDRRLCNRSKDASLLGSPRRRWVHPEHRPRNFTLLGRGSRLCLAIAYFRCSRTKRTLPRLHGMW